MPAIPPLSQPAQDHISRELLQHFASSPALVLELSSAADHAEGDTLILLGWQIDVIRDAAGECTAHRFTQLRTGKEYLLGIEQGDRFFGQIRRAAEALNR